ncbi:hypothetical protein Tco_0950930 [Tanacetum coccineum]|uniref:Uncharacterized protein n=1 Tax=Tanacetum coccineum TaxID=301880 RepID=A0ABQ5DSN8_9ASTR
MKAVCKLDVFVVSKAPKPSSQTKEVPQGKNHGAKSGLRRKQSSKHTSESQTEASKSKTGQSEIETKYSLAKDKILSHHLPPTPVVGEMHKEAQKAAGGPTSLGATSEEGAHPQLSSENNSGGFIRILKDTRSAFFTPDSPQDDLIIVTDESEEEEAGKEDTHDTSHDVPEDTLVPPPPSPKSSQIQELMAQLPRDLEEIPTKLETFTSTIYSLTSQVVELKNIQWELPAELRALPILVSSVQKELKTLDSLPNLLNKVTKTLNRFTTVVENASEATTKDVPSAGQATASPAKGENNTKDAETNLKDELVDLLGTNVVTQYYNKKLLFDKYCDKMLKRKKSPKITNCEVLTKKGHITLKLYREDGSKEVMSNLKVSDLHLAEWREVIQACPDKSEKG